MAASAAFGAVAQGPRVPLWLPPAPVLRCRPDHRWPERLDSGLRQLCPNPGLAAVTTLAPPTRQDVQTSAEQRGLDGVNVPGRR